MSDFDNDALDSIEGGTGERPAFLTVLCILTWIGSGLGVLSALWSLATTSMMGDALEMSELQMEEAMEQMEQMDEPGMNWMSGFMEEGLAALKYALPLNLSALAGAILCIMGAVMMWKLKKSGYFMYVAGALLGPLVTAILIGFGFSASIGFVISIAFIIMYGVNVKYMK